MQKRRRPTEDTKQQTIQHLFSTTKLAEPPKQKRQKLSNESSPATYQETLPATSMYSFPARNKQNAPNVIDLTDSPTASPSPRKPLRPARNSYNPNLGAKKIIVKNLRTAPSSIPQQYFEQTWQKLEVSLDAIFGTKEIPYSMEELYRGAENVCRQGHSADLCGRLEEKAQLYAGHLQQSIWKNIDAASTEVLQEVVNAWAMWSKQMEIVRQIFYYMDRAYLLQAKRASIQEMGVTIFRNAVFEDQRIQQKTLEGFCDLLQADRASQLASQVLSKNAVTLFHVLGVYVNVVEPRLLRLAQDYIMDWTEKAVKTMTLAEYARSSMELMESELNRCKTLGLDLSTRRDLEILLEHQIVERRQETLLNSTSIAGLLDDNAVADLARVYTMLARRSLQEKLKKPFDTWIDKTGTDIIYDPEQEDAMVVRLLTMKRQLDNIWIVAFQRNTILGHGLRETFQTFINRTKKTSGTWGTDNSKPGEMIAKYVDMLLRGGSKAIPEALVKRIPTSEAAEEEDENEAKDEDTEVNNQLDQVLDLFRFVNGKAVFEAFYKKDLARRLLMGRSASADAERSMLSRLKTECGSNFTQNLEQMFKDVELGREEMGAYKSYLEQQGTTPAIDLDVNILCASAWPTYPDIPVNVPTEIKKEIDRFELHYKSKHSGRKLEWKHALAHCQMKASFPKGKKEIVVSSFQAFVLLLFNGVGENEKISYETLKEETGLVDTELVRTLQSLACAKLRPLQKHPKGRDVNPTDTFSLNAGFTHEKYRVKINQVQLKETKEENKETHERVQADRNFETQAAIVRIMKSKKTIGHQALLIEVVEATKKRGVLSFPDIKKNIDRLIEKEYMEREDGNMYSYVA
ncbi:hypothetical protein EG327_006768 [Venturia inaequalis]|uniref:Cullin family profile domain-containing protein n=1 Tax=Venturia inaequalis TaxID=5025 RepID=A0A8H3VT98_VENIN|nr:hypothetical protein EG327_006768 [Venturia inaequalis]